LPSWIERCSNQGQHAVLPSAPLFEQIKQIPNDRSPSPYRNSYIDGPLPIGFSVQMSAPHVHGTTLELLQPYLKAGGTFLDVGSGSGFMCAAMALAAGEGSVVHAIEHIPELAEHSKLNIEDAGAGHLLESGIPASVERNERVKMVGRRQVG